MVDNVVLNFLENWYVIFAIVVLVIAAVVVFIRNLSITKMKEWLKYAVSIAEKELGSGTGQLKLRQVYNSFVEKYKWISVLISFEKFSELVDEALEWMRNEMEKNEKINNYITEDK